jgi:ParB-like chromosome segregation protein Spo0J
VREPKRVACKDPSTCVYGVCRDYGCKDSGLWKINRMGDIIMTTQEATEVNGTTQHHEEPGDFAGDHAGDVRLVPLSAIKVDEKRNVRSYYDPEYIEALAIQLKAQGLLTPLTVDQDMGLWAGFCRIRALHIVHKDDKHALVKVTVRPIEQEFQGLLLNIGENTGRRDLNDYDLGKRLFELEDEDGKYGIKRAMIQRQTGLSRSRISMLINCYTNASPTIRKAWSASLKGELLGGNDKPVTIPTTRIADWVKKEPKEQQARLEAFLDGDRPTLSKEEDEEDEAEDTEPSKPKSSAKGKEEDVARAPTRAELRDEHDRLEEKKKAATKTSDWTDLDAGRFQMIRWVLGMISRPY